jgi:exopolyphosphatase/guanosine-5'-triphosphate,3'-diphosphate pyrophosphatase
MKIAAMDLGTNTFRLLISENTGGKLNKIYRETNITRLGEQLKQNNVINDTAIGRSVKILKKYKLLSEHYGVNKVLAAGTSAFRTASNCDSLISFLKDETGINIKIITGKEEAELTVKGVLGSMNSSLERFYHLDIGGGSTEVSLIDSGEIENSCSMELGVVSLAEELERYSNNLDEVNEKVRRILIENLSMEIEKNTNLPLVATSGTPIVVACILNSVKKFDASRVNKMKIRVDEIEKIKNRLIKDFNSDKLNKYGEILKGREDLIIPGTIILSETMKYLTNDCMIISESGLLEGLSYS